MSLHQRIIASILACIIAAATVGCSTMKTIYPVKGPAAPAPFGTLGVGEEVLIQTHDGRRERVLVRSIESDTIVSQQGDRYSQKDVALIQRKTFSPLKAALWTVGGIAGTIALLTALLSQMVVFPS